MANESGKQYGLIIPKKGSSQDIIQRPSIFDDGSDSGDSGPGEGDWKKKAYQRQATKSVEKRQTKIQIQKALNEDARIFQYDEVYDEIKEKEIKAAPKKEEKKQSRYIQSLKRNAEKRKMENERRLERQIQKERQEEGEEFKDKETFVTSSYKKKLEEFQKMDEEEKRMDRLEEIGDVSKQKDISGFYRHLYRTTVDVEKPGSIKDQEIKKESEEKTELAKKSPNKEQSNPVDNKKQKRQYRKRRKSRSSREEGEKTTSSSSASSSSSSSSESENEVELEKIKREIDDKSKILAVTKTPDKKDKSRGKENIEKSTPAEAVGEKRKKLEEPAVKDEGKNETKAETKSASENHVKSPVEVKPSVNIWLKRTVGANFDSALQRYFERKSKRQGSY